jgi:hypothetical protein
MAGQRVVPAKQRAVPAKQRVVPAEQRALARGKGRFNCRALALALLYAADNETCANGDADVFSDRRHGG